MKTASGQDSTAGIFVFFTGGNDFMQNFLLFICKFLQIIPELIVTIVSYSLLF
jgi:hypothetical protein